MQVMVLVVAERAKVLWTLGSTIMWQVGGEPCLLEAVQVFLAHLDDAVGHGHHSVVLHSILISLDFVQLRQEVREFRDPDLGLVSCAH